MIHFTLWTKTAKSAWRRRRTFAAVDEETAVLFAKKFRRYDAPGRKVEVRYFMGDKAVVWTSR